MNRKTLARQVLLGCAISAGLLVAIYGILLFIHRDDRAPSAAALSLASVLLQRPAVAPADNAYVYLMGMDSAPEADVRAAGATRIAALETAARTQSFATLAASASVYRSERSAAVEALSMACGQAASVCGAALERDPAAASAWAEAERWLHARYQVLIAHPHWRASPAMFDGDAPLPPLALVADGQMLHFIGVWQRAGKSDAGAVRALLDADLRFWRQVFAASDTVLMKTAAGTALRRHFALGTMALRRLPAQRQAEAIPDQWRTPLSMAEKSLRAPLAGELKSLELILRNKVAGSGGAATGMDVVAMLRPAFKLQASLNEQAGKLQAQASAFDVDYRDLPQALRSPAGKSNPLPHALSAADVEGVRRVHLLLVELRSAGVAPAAMAAKVAGAALTDPYTGAPFGWDEKRGSIVFRGLEPGPRGVSAAPL